MYSSILLCFSKLLFKEIYWMKVILRNKMYLLLLKEQNVIYFENTLVWISFSFWCQVTLGKGRRLGDKFHAFQWKFGKFDGQQAAHGGQARKPPLSSGPYGHYLGQEVNWVNLLRGRVSPSQFWGYDFLVFQIFMLSMNFFTWFLQNMINTMIRKYFVRICH